MASKEAPGGPIVQPVVEVQSLNQPEDEPILEKDTEEKLSEKFKTEEHVRRSTVTESFFRARFTENYYKNGNQNLTCSM